MHFITCNLRIVFNQLDFASYNTFYSCKLHCFHTCYLRKVCNKEHFTCKITEEDLNKPLLASLKTNHKP